MAEKGKKSTEEIISDNQDSIALTRNSKGYTWAVKLYYNANNIDPKDIIQEIENIDKALIEKFGGA